MAFLGTNERGNPWSCQGLTPSVGECQGGRWERGVVGEGEHLYRRRGGEGDRGFMDGKPDKRITFEIHKSGDYLVRVKVIINVSF